MFLCHPFLFNFLTFLLSEEAPKSMIEKEGFWILEDFQGPGATDPQRSSQEARHLTTTTTAAQQDVRTMR